MRTGFGLAAAAAILAGCAQVPAPSLTGDAGAMAAAAILDETVVSIAPGAHVKLFIGGSESIDRETPKPDWPTFRVCRTDASPLPVTLLTGPLNRVGPRHPEVRHLSIAPGGCHFISGPIIEAVGAPPDLSIVLLSNTGGSADADAAADRAQAWFTARIAALEAEPASPAGDLLLEEFRRRASALGNQPPAATLAVKLVTPQPAEYWLIAKTPNRGRSIPAAISASSGRLRPGRAIGTRKGRQTDGHGLRNAIVTWPISMP